MSIWRIFRTIFWVQLYSGSLSTVNVSCRLVTCSSGRPREDESSIATNFVSLSKIEWNGDHHIYIHTVEHFSRHFHRPPDQLGPEHIRQYQAALFTRWKLAPNTVTQRLAALRFFYVQVLKRGWSVAETPYPKKVLHLPEILSQEEVARLIDAAEFPFHRILLMTLYATGARRAEVAHLKISDIDSQRMVIHIRGGKGRKDRDVMLSPKLLDALRVYWRGLKRKPTDWLFPGNRWHTASHPTPLPTALPKGTCANPGLVDRTLQGTAENTLPMDLPPPIGLVPNPPSLQLT